jgi:calcineurin-like phosphoesterase family protein
MKLVLEKDQKLFFTSDTHYHHANICSATSQWSKSSLFNFREFNSLEHMNTTLVNNINEVVGENDILIHLGDWSFGGFEKIEEFRSRLVCKNIHLVLGNHDHHIERNKGNVQDLFLSVQHYINLDIRRPSRTESEMDKYKFVLMHYPIASWDGLKDGVIHLHGHVHLSPDKRISRGKAMDVGCEGNNLSPMSLDEVLQLLKKQPLNNLILPYDHHTLIK